MFRFQPAYLLAAGGLLLMEVVIALFVHDAIIRPYGGDFLATLLVYCLIRGSMSVSASKAGAGALLVSYLIEALQYFGLLARLGWQHNKVACLLLGSHFEWSDLLTYTLAAALAVMLAKLGPLGFHFPKKASLRH